MLNTPRPVTEKKREAGEEQPVGVGSRSPNETELNLINGRMNSWKNGDGYSLKAW